MISVDLYNIKILVVGAGGIGCEVLKNLVMSGFKKIEVIDLDTIELSNLNRQFLFQKVHVGHSKAEIAKKSVMKFNSDATIISHHDNIMKDEYNVDYFKSFGIVLNALDNKAARSHVNRLCLAADIPLIESGSAGYLGQVTVIRKGVTECYDCLPKPTIKSFPGCTIRNTPSEPVHCIVWAKHLFNQLFGNEDPDEAVSPDTADPENSVSNVKKIFEENLEERISTRKWAEETNYDAKKIFNKLYNEDIKYLLSMHKLWETRKAPEPLEFDSINEIGDSEQSTNNNEKLESQSIWSIRECLQNFCESIKDLKNRLNNENRMLIWDKDDESSLKFVTAAANLRSVVFSIPLKSKFDIKSIAGNIIPAIATTNAVIAGFIVLQTIKLLSNGVTKCKTIYLRDRPLQQKLIVDSYLVKPNDKCYVCVAKPELVIKLNTDKFTVKQLETEVLKNELNMIAPDVEIDDGSGRIIISSEEGETEDNKKYALSFYGLIHGSRLKCDDFLQNFEITIIIFHNYEMDGNYEIITEPISANLNSGQENELKKLNKKRMWPGENDEVTNEVTKKVKLNTPNSLDEQSDLALSDKHQDNIIINNESQMSKQNDIEFTDDDIISF